MLQSKDINKCSISELKKRKLFLIILFTICPVYSCIAQSKVNRVKKMTFAEAKDVLDIYGKPSFDADGLELVGDAIGLPPGMTPTLAVLGEDGAYYLFGQIVNSDGSWHICRAQTIDGKVFTNVENVYSGRSLAPNDKKWLGFATMGRRGIDGHMFFYKWSQPYGTLWVYESPDGTNWQSIKKPVLKGHDCNSVFWDDATEQFIFYQATNVEGNKPFPDNISQTAQRRRNLAMRTSSDGILWLPDERFTAEMPQIRPDEKDPEEMEFYRFVVFRQDGRYVGMQLNYAASPGYGNAHYPIEKYRNPGQKALHGPHLSGEWWISDNGFHWRRPFRSVFATGESNGIIIHEPMRIGHDLLWTDGVKVYALSNERIFCIRSLANAAFTTQSFEVSPSMKWLALNATFGYNGDYSSRGMRGQGYIMVEVLDEDGIVIEGFDRDGCMFHDLDVPSRQMENTNHGGVLLLWHNQPLSILAGHNVRLRFYFRDARIYNLRWHE